MIHVNSFCRPVKGGVDAKELFHLYILIWIEDKRLTLLESCKLDKVYIYIYIHKIFIVISKNTLTYDFKLCTQLYIFPSLNSPLALKSTYYLSGEVVWS